MYTKSRSHANRGQGFEELIRFANSRYENKKVAMISKMPTEFIPIRDHNGKLVRAKVEHKSTVDFIGRYKQHPIAIEAKETHERNIALKRIEPHQVEYMNKFTAQPGTIGLVLVSYSGKHYYAIPWQFWSAAYELRVLQNDTKIPKTVCFFNQEWNIPQKLSLREEDLNPDWAIPPHDFNFGFHYLKHAENYIITEKG